MTDDEKLHSEALTIEVDAHAVTKDRPNNLKDANVALLKRVETMQRQRDAARSELDAVRNSLYLKLAMAERERDELRKKNEQLDIVKLEAAIRKQGACRDCKGKKTMYYECGECADRPGYHSGECTNGTRNCYMCSGTGLEPWAAAALVKP